jgi:cell division septum initiation protein DivIVA
MDIDKLEFSPNVGMAAVLHAILPGMIHMHEELGKEIERIKTKLATLQGQAASPVSKPARARSTGQARSKESGGYWSNMTAEQRSAEMMRRMKKRSKKLHPRDSKHPDHEKWKLDISKRRKAAWAALGPRRQKARLAKMLAGQGRMRKKAKPTPTVRALREADERAVA